MQSCLSKPCAACCLRWRGELATAHSVRFSTRRFRREPKELLPLVREAVPSLRNPAVERALTEVRKVVNAIVREYGKPYEIRIEMARELRKSRKEREEATRQNRTRRAGAQEIAKARILKDCGIQNPSRSDLEKARPVRGVRRHLPLYRTHYRIQLSLWRFSVRHRTHHSAEQMPGRLFP